MNYPPPVHEGIKEDRALKSSAVDHAKKVMTVNEVAAELRCSKAHVHHLIAGTVRGTTALPSVWLGRRRLVLRASFEEWLRTSEQRGA